MVEVKLNIRRKQNQKLTEAKINKNPILVAWVLIGRLVEKIFLADRTNGRSRLY